MSALRHQDGVGSRHHGRTRSDSPHDHLGLDAGFPKTLPARSPPEAEEGTESPDEDSQLDPRVDL